MSPEDILTMARKQAAKGALAQAEQTCQSFLKHSPAHQDALFLLATVQINAKHPEQARKTCEALLLHVPHHSGALNMLGLICLNHGADRKGAIRFLRRAVAANPNDWQALANLGGLLVENPENRSEAVELLEKSKSINPRNFSAHNGLGLIERSNGNFDAALVHFKEALKLNPGNAIVQRNIDICTAALSSEPADAMLKKIAVLATENKLEEAKIVSETALREMPGNTKIQLALAGILVDMGDHRAATMLCERLIHLLPQDPRPHRLLAMTELARTGPGNSKAAIKHLSNALLLAPNDVQLLDTLGIEHYHQGNLAEAQEFLERSVAISPANPNALNTLGQIYHQRREYGIACDYYERALSFAPKNTAVIQNAILAARSARRFGLAFSACQKLLAVEDPGVSAFSVYAFAKRYALWDVTDQLLPHILRQIEVASEEAVGHFMGANLALMASAEVSNKQLYKLHLRVGAAMSRGRIRAPKISHPRALTQRPKMRIGYLSADFRNHSVSKFFMNVFRNHDRDLFEIYLYSNVSLSKEDHITAEYRRRADRFISIHGMPDHVAAERIEQDGINILIDLGGYTAEMRLGVLAYRPAPIQISTLGYPGSTGMPEVDHIITDNWLDNPKLEDFLTETPLKLPESWICFGHLQEVTKSPTPPFERNGYLTIGSLMNPYKFNRRTLDLWCEILRALPEARLYFNHPEYEWTDAIERFAGEFVARGISRKRITFASARHATGNHLHFYDDIDLTLDTMPLTGGTTTVDTLWMGVPVVTRVGDALHERISYSVIRNIGIDVSDLVAFSDSEFVCKAVALARDTERLKALRTTIPETLRGSILCNAERYTAQLEEAYWDTWNKHFPDHGQESLIDPLAQSPVASKKASASVMISTGGTTDPYTYIMHERGSWPDPEVTFLEACAELFPVYWDIADDPGVYALSIAKAQQNAGGKTYAMRKNTAIAKTVEASAEQSHVDNLFVVDNHEANIPSPDLVRVSGSSLQSANLIHELLDCIVKDKSNPLILANFANPNGKFSENLVTTCLASGYRILRLLPGFRLMVPEDDATTLATFPTLFFCPSDRLTLLQSAGLLNLRPPPIERMPTSRDREWLRIIHACRGLSSRAAVWDATPPAGEWGDVYMAALNMLSEAYRKSLAPGQRVTLLQLVLGIFPQLIATEATVPRLLTGIRLMADVGDVNKALHWAEYLARSVKGKSGPVLSEPFIPPLQEWQSWVPPADEARWTYSLALAMQERLRRPTSFSSPEESHASWSLLAEFPWFAPQARRILRLIESRRAELAARH